MALVGDALSKLRHLRLAAITFALWAVFSVQFDEPAISTGIIEREAPIIVESHDVSSVDPDDPELVEEMREVHEAFEAGESRAVAVPVHPDVPFAASVNSGMFVSFDATHPSPSNVQAVVNAAAADWDSAVATTSATPVEIAVIWKDLGNSNLLGSAGPAGLYRGGSLPSDAWVPAPLVNVLLGYDYNGAGTPELTVNLNSQASWYIGTSGDPGWGEIDLYSVVLHEIGHGLGFLGSGSLHNHSPNTVPTLEDTPFVFDQEVTYGGAPLLDYGNADSFLRSNSLFINLSDSLSNKLYAPSTWQEGSSFSHFDESSYPAGSAGALMTPSIGSGQVERTIDAATLGVLARTGWPMRVGAATPTITGASGADGQATVSWTQSLRQVALAPDSYRLEARVGSSVHGSTSVSAATASATVTGLSGGTTYTMAVVPVVDGVDGTAATTSVTTPSSVGSPKAIDVGGEGLTRTVTWLPGDGIAPTSYDIETSLDGGGWTSAGSTSSTAKTLTLSEGVYQVRVRGRSGAVVGGWGYSIPTGVADGAVRPVPLDGQISRLYQAYFLREPDDAGFDYWVGTRANGADLGAISQEFAGSSEFVTAYGSLSNAGFVDLVYANVLDRAPDAEGRAHWIAQLDAGMSRGAVMTGFSESTEFVANTGTSAPQSAIEAEVYRLYVAFFLRTPDASGLAYWVSVRESGASLDAIAASFSASVEFQSDYGSLSDADFVELVYHNVLARNPDAAGVSYWQSLLAAGTDRGAMMIGFSESQEFILATGTVP
ncbi:MAG: DUF4214 domain-containing protein [Actinomycetota bacterium]